MGISRAVLALLFLVSPVLAEGEAPDPWFVSGRAAVERAGAAHRQDPGTP